MRLQNKVALITGGAQGLGAEIARRFRAEGALVFIGDVNEEEGNRTALELDGAVFLNLDVTSEESWKTAFAAVLAKAGRLDVLVNNAGITGFEEGFVPHDPEHATLAAWHAVLATNLDGVFLGCKHAIPLMRAPGGSIVNISSRSGLVGIPGAAAYAASKAAVRNHTKTVALYCAEQGLRIRCNSVHPAAILTPMWEPILGSGPERATREAEYTKDTPLRRFGTIEEVAALVVYLASDESGYTTGAEFVLDGGMLAGTAVPPRPLTNTAE